MLQDVGSTGEREKETCVYTVTSATGKIKLPIFRLITILNLPVFITFANYTAEVDLGKRTAKISRWGADQI